VEKCRRRLKEAQELIRSNAKDVNALIKEVECLLLLGEISSAIISLETIKQLNLKQDFYESNIGELMKLKHLVEQAENYFKLNNYSSALYTINQVISISPASVKFNLMKAEFLAMLGRHSEAQVITNEILEFDELNIEALYLSALSLYYQDEIGQSFQYFQTLLRLCPDHSKANIVYQKASILLSKKEQGNEAFSNGNFQSACEIYSSTLLIDPINKIMNAKLYFNRCLARAKLNQLDQAYDDCNQALNLNENYMKAHHKRAKLLMTKGMFEEAVHEYEWIYLADPSIANKRVLEAAKMRFKISKNKDHYKTLGVGRTATIEEITKAYRELSKKHYTDIYQNESESKKKEQEETIKGINEAYDVLKDPMKRLVYDA
jgi:DnaJ family protein C protein 7